MSLVSVVPDEEATQRIWQRLFLKWAGGKYSLLPELDRLIPAGKRLIEPFVGGGSVFLNSDMREKESGHRATLAKCHLRVIP